MPNLTRKAVRGYSTVSGSSKTGPFNPSFGWTHDTLLRSSHILYAGSKRRIGGKDIVRYRRAKLGRNPLVPGAYLYYVCGSVLPSSVKLNQDSGWNVVLDHQCPFFWTLYHCLYTSLQSAVLVVEFGRSPRGNIVRKKRKKNQARGISSGMAAFDLLFV